MAQQQHLKDQFERERRKEGGGKDGDGEEDGGRGWGTGRDVWERGENMLQAWMNNVHNAPYAC